MMMLNSIIQSLNDNIGSGLRKAHDLSEMEFNQVLTLSEESLEEGLKKQFLQGDVEGLMDAVLHGENTSKNATAVIAELNSRLRQDIAAGLLMDETKVDQLSTTIVDYALNELGQKLINSRFEDNAAGLIELTGLNKDEDFMSEIHSVIHEGQLSNSGLNQLFRNQ